MQVGVDVTYIHTNFGGCNLSSFGDIANFKNGHILYMAVFEISNISETGGVTPTKISVHVCYINTYLHDFF